MDKREQFVNETLVLARFKEDFPERMSRSAIAAMVFEQLIRGVDTYEIIEQLLDITESHLTLIKNLTERNIPSYTIQLNPEATKEFLKAREF